MNWNYSQFLCLLGSYAFAVFANVGMGRVAKLPEEVVRLRPARQPLQARYSRLVAACIFSWMTLAIVLGLSGFVGMIFLWHIAPRLFLIATAMKILHPPFDAWSARGGWEWLFVDIELFLDGVILSTVFFGPFQHLFQ